MKEEVFKWPKTHSSDGPSGTFFYLSTQPYTANKLFKTMFTSVMIPEVTVPSVVTVPTVVPVQ